MTRIYDIAILVGSLRQGSLNKKLAHALANRAPSHLNMRFVGIGELPLYNADLEDNIPYPWAHFREEMAKADGVLFVTPEYNRTIPGALKNAIDVGSRPMGSSVWSGKPAGVVTGSPGGMGAFGANHVLRQSLVFLNMPAMQQPEAYIGGIGDLFDDEGKIKNADTDAFLTKYMSAFGEWVTLTAR